MKKYALAFFLLSTVLLTVGCTAQQELDFNAWFSPYQEMINEVNEENRWTLTVVDQEAFYRTYKDCSIDEAKDDIIQEYLQGLADTGDAVVSETAN